MARPRYPAFVQVAAVQLPSTLDRRANRRRAVERVREAAGRGARVVVLPEASMCSFGNAGTDLAACAEPLGGPFVAALHQVAGETGTTVVAGTFEPAGEPRRVHNTVVAVDGGGLLGAYRKVHLYNALGWRESNRIAPGDPAADPLVVAVGGLRFGVMNCYDLRFPESARRLVDAGATALVEVAHWLPGPGKVEAWTVLLRARAIESTAYVVAAAKPGPACTGHSMVVGPGGDVLASLGADETGLVVADLVAERVAEVRASMPVLDHRRFGVVPGT